jgi:hypothetical protein
MSHAKDWMSHRGFGCEIDPLSGKSCTSVDDYHMSLPRVELDNINQPDDRRLKPARLP